MQQTNLPREWEITNVTNVFSQISTTGKNIKIKDCLEFGMYPVIDQGEEYISGYFDDESKVIKVTDSIIAFGDHTKNIKWIDFDFIVGADGVKLFQPKKGINARFFYYQIKNFALPDKGYHRHFRYLQECDFKIPPLSEQTHLANLLDDLTTRVQKIQESLSRIPELLKTFRQSVLARAVSGELTEKWREENNYSAEQELSNLIEKERKYLSEKHKDSYEKILKEKEKLRLEKYDLTEVNIPKGWVMKPFFEFSLLNRGFDLPTSERIEGNYPILSSAGVIGFHNEYRVKGECVTVGRSGSVGQVFYTKQDCWVLNTALYVKDFGFSYPKFVFYKLKSMNLGQYAASTAVPTLNRNEFILELLKIPPYEEQQQIVHQVEHYFALADEIERQTKLAQEKVNYLTQSILTKAFRGELTANWRAANQAVISGENSAKALLQKIEAAMKMGKK